MAVITVCRNDEEVAGGTGGSRCYVHVLTRVQHVNSELIYSDK
jgi:hypothetical protein